MWMVDLIAPVPKVTRQDLSETAKMLMNVPSMDISVLSGKNFELTFQSSKSIYVVTEIWKVLGCTNWSKQHFFM
jgi:hypothetical protein